MKAKNRREFLKCGAILGATMASPGLGAPVVHASPTSAQGNGSRSKTRTLGSGKNTIEVNYGFGLGCMGMSFNRSFIPDRAPMIALIRRAYDMNVNLYDTAEAYGPFTNEELGVSPDASRSQRAKRSATA